MMPRPPIRTRSPAFKWSTNCVNTSARTVSACFFGSPCRSTTPAERCFSVTVVGAATFAGAFAPALLADLAEALAAVGFASVRDLVPALAFVGAGGGGVLFRFAGSLVLVAVFAMSLRSLFMSLDNLVAANQDARERRL